MALSTLALLWACLAQVPAPSPGSVAPLTKRSFPIPINIDESRRAEIRQLILFGSDDQGKTWNQIIASPPDKLTTDPSGKSAFPFTARHDGLYWFCVCVVDQQGKQQPDSPYTAPVALKVLIDTVTPTLKITAAERQGDEVVVAWEIQEERADLNSLRLEYRPADGSSSNSWTNVPIAATGFAGRSQFRPTTAAAVAVRMEIKDQVGNVGTDQKDVAAGPTAITGGTPPAAAPLPAPGPFPSPVASMPSPVGRSDLPPPLAANQSNYVPAAPPAYPPPIYPTAGATPLPSAGSDMRTIAYSGPTDSAAPGLPAAPLHHGSLPKAQLVNDPHVSVEYTVSKFGASGVGKVELWVTRDEGVTWQYLTDDPDVGGRDPGQKQRLMATLPGEGVFGLRLVTQSGAGLGREPPKSGDVPELRIEVDTTPPLVKLFEPRPDQLQRDVLVLSWSAQDRNLVAKPIVLEYAEQRDGPWLPIIADLPNTGSYNWQVPKTVPYQAFLRVSAVDSAGNRSTAQAHEASLIDLNKPEGHLVGIAVQPRTAPPAPPAVPDDRQPPIRERRSGF